MTQSVGQDPAEPHRDAPTVTRRTMLRRSAIAGGALLWVTPAVQTLGNSKAYAWHRGSEAPGCTCNEAITDVVAVACWPDKTAKHKIAKTGKTVQLEVIPVSGCGGTCNPQNERNVWTQVKAVGCELLTDDPTDRFCEVHVDAHPAYIVLHVASSIDCVGPHGHTKTCTGTKTVRICFSDNVDHACDRCGRFPPHKNTTHGTEACR